MYTIEAIQNILNKYITTKSPLIRQKTSKLINISKEEYYSNSMHKVLLKFEPKLYNYLVSILGERFKARDLYNYIHNATGVCEYCGKTLNFISLLNGYDKCENYINDMIEYYKDKSLKDIFKLSEIIYKKVMNNNHTESEKFDKFINNPILSKLVDFTGLKTFEDVYLYFHPDVVGKNICPICGKPIKFKRYGEINAYNEFCSIECRNKWWTQRQRDDNTGWRSTEETLKRAREMQSINIKNKIKNGLFTPNVTNSWCHSKIVVKYYYDGELIIRKVRSAWEAMFQLMNPELSYETLRIPYMNSKKEMHNYIVDFVDTVNKIAYEVKPSKEIENRENGYKFKALKKWCKDNGYTYEIITEEYFIEHQFKTSLMEYLDKEYLDKMLDRISKYPHFNILYEDKENN